MIFNYNLSLKWRSTNIIAGQKEKNMILWSLDEPQNQYNVNSDYNDRTTKLTDCFRLELLDTGSVTCVPCTSFPFLVQFLLCLCEHMKQTSSQLKKANNNG